MSRPIAARAQCVPPFPRPPKLTITHGRTNTRLTSTARVPVVGAGDDADAAGLRRQAENLFECDIAELTIDLAKLEDAGPLLLRTLSDLVKTARGRHCTLSIVGVRSPLLLEAFRDTPLDQLDSVRGGASPDKRIA